MTREQQLEQRLKYVVAMLEQRCFAAVDRTAEQAAQAQRIAAGDAAVMIAAIKRDLAST